MSLWELIFLRNQATSQRAEIGGARTNTALFESAAATALTAAQRWQRLSEQQEKRIAELNRELDRGLDQEEHLRRTLRGLREQYAQLAAANGKLLRERHVLLDLTNESVSRNEARNMLIRELREKLGRAELDRLLGSSAHQRLAALNEALAADAQWQQKRSGYVSDEIARRVKELEQTPFECARAT